MNIKISILFCILVCHILTGSAQQTANPQDTLHIQDSSLILPRNLTIQEFQNLFLPPLEVLFENAQNNPRLKALDASIASSEYDKSLVKRDWFKYLSLHAGYNYGILGTYVDHETDYQPLTTTYSGSTQHSWSVGANLSIPLDHLINHRLTVKKQKAIVDIAQSNREIALYEIKNEIVELYANIQYQLKTLKGATKSLTLSTSEYQAAEKDYINNFGGANKGLSELKRSQQLMQREYDMLISQLNVLIFKLELLSNTKIINTK